jgi:hypothetical protein
LFASISELITSLFINRGGSEANASALIPALAYRD